VPKTLSFLTAEANFNVYHSDIWRGTGRTFAELIVRECGEVAYKAYWNNPETVRGIHIKEKIKKHFGVKE
jgi:hypothetical protein